MSETQTSPEVESTEQASAPITVNSDPNVQYERATFRFKKDKMGNKRPNVELHLPVPSNKGLVNILTKGGKGLELLREAIYDVVRGVAADFVSADEKISQDTLPVDKLLWDAIANMPKEDRRSSTIPQEQWEAFAKDYIEVMPGVTGKSAEAVGNAVEVYMKKFSIVKTNKPVLNKLKEQISLYTDRSPNAENFSDILELLTKRIDTYLAADDVQALISNL